MHYKTEQNSISVGFTYPPFPAYTAYSAMIKLSTNHDHDDTLDKFTQSIPVNVNTALIAYMYRAAKSTCFRHATQNTPKLPKGVSLNGPITSLHTPPTR